MLEKLLRIIAPMLLCLAVIVTGCTDRGYRVSNAGNGYKKLTIESGIARFSFEYPSKWNIGNVEFKPDYTALNISGPDFELASGKLASSTCWVMLIHHDSKTAEASLEDDLVLWSKQLDFKLIEKTDAQIAGTVGKQALFTYRSIQMPEFQGGPGGTPVPETIKLITFESKGWIWNIDVNSNSEVVRRDDVHFEHLLKTFKILD